MQHFPQISVIISMDRASDSSRENETVRKILTGNKEAFKEIIEKYQKLVMHIVFRLLRGSSDREDICQEVFIKVYQNLQYFRGDSKFSTWIGKITYNTCLNYLKKRKKNYLNKSLNENLQNSRYYGDTSLPYDYIESQDLWKKLQQEMDKIPERYRTILTLYHMDNLGYREIGDIMDLPEGTVKNYLFRARQKLKMLITKKYEWEEL